MKPSHEALRRVADHEDESSAVENEIEPDEMRAEPAELGPQPRLHRGHEHRAEKGPERGAETPDDGGEREAHREVDRENVERVDEADVLRPERATDGGECGAHRNRDDLEPARSHAERERGVLVLAYRGELVAAPRALE